MQPVRPEADPKHGEEHQQRHREGDDDVARDRERVGDEAEEIREEDEDEQREDHREEALAFFAHDAEHGVSFDEAVDQLDHRLHAARHDAVALDAEHQHQRRGHDRQNHPEARIGEGEVEPADVNRNDRIDLELRHRAVAVGRHAVTSLCCRFPHSADASCG